MYFEEKKKESPEVKPLFMRKPEAAKYLRVGETKIEDMFKDGRLTKCYIDTCVLISVRQMDSLHDSIFDEFYKELVGGIMK
jgi:hypothetical protein